ncbi:MAG: chromosomal replication initiator protein DnaA [Phycisphaerales bacterium]|nr:MAG: chromosomal replication initiator protein DnaA [Phycisphaerales bacterium]
MIVCAQDWRAQLEARISEQVGPQRFNVWFKNVAQFEFTEAALRVSVANQFVGDWVERHFRDVIAKAAEDIAGRPLEVAFSTDPNLAGRLGRKQPDRQVAYLAGNPERVAREHRRSGSLPTVQTLRLTMEDFVTGQSNRIAHAAATAVIEAPGGPYNPLFIHGGCGLGKTHLLQAICNGIRQRHAAHRWRYVTGEEFTNDYVYSVKAREQDAFRQRYRHLDVLVIDDVHFFANKRATQEEFLHTFNAIASCGKQVVLSSDAQPKMIGHLSDHIVSRLLAGMVVRIDSPDLELRREILRQRAARLKVRIPESVIQYIAENFLANIRELEGGLLRIVADAEMTGSAVTLVLAQRVVRELVRHTAPVIRLADIESTVAIFFGLSPTDLHTTRKTRTIALARGIAMYLARKHTDMSYPEIGRFMGRKNHTTVLLAQRRISQSLQRNETARWVTPVGQKELNLAILIQDLEEQLGHARQRENVA